jgi:hypothetical protein
MANDTGSAFPGRRLDSVALGQLCCVVWRIAAICDRFAAFLAYHTSLVASIRNDAVFGSELAYMTPLLVEFKLLRETGNIA